MEEIKLRPHAKYYILVWTGLFKDEDAKHYKKMGKAIWLFLSLLHTANASGEIKRLQFKTINERTGISISTLKKFMAKLRRSGYIRTWSSGRYLSIEINNWEHYSKKKEEQKELMTKYLDSINRSSDMETSDEPKKEHQVSKKKTIGNKKKSLFPEEHY